MATAPRNIWVAAAASFHWTEVAKHALFASVTCLLPGCQLIPLVRDTYHSLFTSQNDTFIALRSEIEAITPQYLNRKIIFSEAVQERIPFQQLFQEKLQTMLADLTQLANALSIQPPRFSLLLSSQVTAQDTWRAAGLLGWGSRFAPPVIRYEPQTLTVTPQVIQELANPENRKIQSTTQQFHIAREVIHLYQHHFPIRCITAIASACLGWVIWTGGLLYAGWAFGTVYVITALYTSLATLFQYTLARKQELEADAQAIQLIHSNAGAMAALQGASDPFAQVRLYQITG